MTQVKSQSKSMVSSNDRFLTIAEMFYNGVLTKDEFVGLVTMLNTSVAEDFIASKVGN